MKTSLRERKPSRYNFDDEYDSEDLNDAESNHSEEEINYCHECDSVFEDVWRLHKHLLRHIKQPAIRLERLTIAPIRITLKASTSGDFTVVQSPLSSPSVWADYTQQQQGVCAKGGTVDDEVEEKYIIPDADPADGAVGVGVGGVGGGVPVGGLVVPKSDVSSEGNEEEEEEEDGGINVSFSPTYASIGGEMILNENSEESQLSSGKPSTDSGYVSGIPGADPTPPPDPSPDNLMPKIRIKSSGLLMAPERESPQGLTITEITDDNGGDQVDNIQFSAVDPFAGVDAWGTGSSNMEDPLRLPDTIESDGNIISNLFTNNTDRAKDLGLTSSDSEFISMDGLDNRNNNSMNTYHSTDSSHTTTSTNQSLIPSVSNALVGLPMQQLAQQVSRLQQQPGGQMHQQNVLINIQQFPQAPPQQQPQVPQVQVQPYGMYHHPQYQYAHQPYQPYAQPSLYYTPAPPAYGPPQHMPPPPAPLHHPHMQQQQQQQPPQQHHPQQQQLPAITQPQQQHVQTQPGQQSNAPIILGAVSQLTPGQPLQQQQVQQQQPGVHLQQALQPQQVQQGVQGYNQQQQPQLQQQGQAPPGYNQGTYGQPAVQRPPVPLQQQQGNRMMAPRAPMATGPRMAGPRGPPMTARAPYSPRQRMPMNRGRGGPIQSNMRGRARFPSPQMNGQRPGGQSQQQQQHQQPVKRSPEQMAAIAAKRRRMEASSGLTATVKVEDEEDMDDCELVSVQPKGATLPKIQSVQGAVPEGHAEGGGVMHLSDSITLSVRQPPPRPPSPKAQSSAKAVANVLAARGITVTAAPKDLKGPHHGPDPVPINLNKSDDRTPTVDLTDEVPVPAPKTIPPPSAAPISTAAPAQPFKCDQCPARYATNVALVKHRQAAHKTCNQMDYGVPLIDLRQPGIMNKLTNFGIYNYIPLPAANVSGMFALPVISMNAVKNNVNLSALGNSMLTLGPIRKIQKPAVGNQSPPPKVGRPPLTQTTPTKQH